MLISTISVKRSVCNICYSRQSTFRELRFFVFNWWKNAVFYPFLKDMKRELKYL